MRHALGRLLERVRQPRGRGRPPRNGAEGLTLARELRPDVITLDVEMPVLDGLGDAQAAHARDADARRDAVEPDDRRTPVTLDALEFGAIDFVPKPSGHSRSTSAASATSWSRKIEAAAAMSEAAFLRHRQVAAMNLTLAGTPRRRAATAAGRGPRATAPGEAAARSPAAGILTQPGGRRSASAVAATRLVVVASSTGGPSALHAFVKGLPAHSAPRSPSSSTCPRASPRRSPRASTRPAQLRCTEATAEDVLVEDEILRRAGRPPHDLLDERPHPARPSAARQRRPAGGRRDAPGGGADLARALLCVVLTGMGVDAREGARAVKQHGGTVISQDAGHGDDLRHARGRGRGRARRPGPAAAPRSPPRWPAGAPQARRSLTRPSRGRRVGEPARSSDRLAS